ncbi:tetratricopeptide repeat protein [Thauera sp.]|uniref:tetratricopeptide repeat protein n=1 Tax=Thauera sp. TaxID=1905334 RepID=UPI002603AB33|nr:tetratricopeptide repeat protein [Thauera sp.]MCK6408354.1 tetratricopeptide repeat protein [Thauera sp.]
MDKVLRTATALLGLFGVVAGVAAGTEADYQTLRAWCVQRTANQDNAAWQAANNPQKYFHFQHFCFAMQWENKLITAANQKDRVAAANTIINETSYVIRHVPRTHPLIPEVHALRGRAYDVSRRHVEAESDLLSALQLDPRHARAAVQLATLYVKTDRRDKAAEVVRAALSGSPGDFRLRKMGEDLGVKLPPARPPAQDQPRPASPGVAAQPADLPVAGESSPAADAAAQVRSAATVGEGAEDGSGTSTNACRFCPPEDVQKRWRDSFAEPQKP